MRVLLYSGKLEDQLGVNTYDKCVSIEQIHEIGDAQATVLDAQDLLDFFPQRPQTLQLFLRKIRKGGRLEMCGLDLEEVGRALYNKTAPVEQVSSILYRGRMSGASLLDLKSLFANSQDFKIIHSRLDGLKYYLTIGRN